MRRRAVIALPVMLIAPTAFGQADSMRLFRDHALEIIRNRYPDVPAKSGPDDGSISIDSSTVNLDNIYARASRLSKSEREVAVVDFLASVVESYRQSRTGDELTWAEAKELLRPRLVSPEYLRPAPDALRRDFAPDVFLGYAIDYGRQVRFVDHKDLERWQVEFDQVHDAAIANLEALSASVPVDVRKVRGGRFAAVETGDSYDAARLALPRFRHRLMAAVGEPMFVGVPNRDFLVAWSSDIAQFATFVAKVAEDFGQQPYAITDAIFRVDRKGVRPATVEERSRR